MANDVAGYPWKLDTVANNIVTGTVWVMKIRWVGATTAAHAATITDGNGRVVWTSLASGSNYVETDTYPPSSVLKIVGTASTGLCVTTLSSGVLYIYGH